MTFGTRRSLIDMFVAPISDPESVRKRLIAKTAVNDLTGCHEWQGNIHPKGYGMMSYRNTQVRTHRISYAAFVGPIPHGLHVLHRCDNRRCINPDHLFLGTNYDNIKDMMSKGRGRKVWTKSRRATGLSASEVIAIRARVAAGERQSVLEAEYQVHQSTISHIVRRKRWRHLEESSQ